MANRIWLITGISKGLGRALAEEVVHQGDFVVGTVRQDTQVQDFNRQFESKGYACKADMRNTADIRQVILQLEERFGQLDVLVNNAGFGFAGAIEETSAEEAREVFETNFFGTLEMTRAALPIFRKQKSGHIIQVSSHSGFKGFPGFGIYGASKFALEGISESLEAELSPLGIRVTIVEPGPFRTGFAGESFLEAKTRIADYEQTAGAFRERIRTVNGKQEGDPAKAAKAIYQITNLENPPLRLPLGKTAILTLRSKLESVQKDLDAWKGVAEAAVF